MDHHLRYTQTAVKSVFACGAMDADCAPCKICDMVPRLSEIRETKRLKLEEIAAQLEVAISTVSRWEAGDTNIPSKRLPEIASAYRCDVWEIFTDKGDLPLTIDKAPERAPTRDASQGEIVQIIQLDLSLPMGPGSTIDEYVEEQQLDFDLAYIRSFTRTPPNRLRLARGIGESMYPTLNNMDLVWIDSTQRHLNQSDRVWAVSINGAAAIKRLRPMKAGRVLVMSDNPAIGDYEVDADELLIGGRVIRFARDL